jgi:hypothetical protein
LEGVEPLGNDQNIHPAEEHIQEHDLRNELEDKVEGLVEINSIESLHADSH